LEFVLPESPASGKIRQRRILHPWPSRKKKIPKSSCCFYSPSSHSACFSSQWSYSTTSPSCSPDSILNLSIIRFRSPSTQKRAVSKDERGLPLAIQCERPQLTPEASIFTPQKYFGFLGLKSPKREVSEGKRPLTSQHKHLYKHFLLILKQNS
jgi:hypothetical protein